jgi:hypothetical protein
MEASSARKRVDGGKERRVKYLVRLGFSVSPRYGPFSLGARFESYKPSIYLFNVQFLFRAAVNNGY